MLHSLLRDESKKLELLLLALLTYQKVVAVLLVFLFCCEFAFVWIILILSSFLSVSCNVQLEVLS